MKGLELPINIIIVIAIAVLVLVVVSAFFAGQTGAGFGSIDTEQAFAQGCGALRAAYSCNPSAITTVKIQNYKEGANDPNANQHTLADICTKKGIDPTNNGGADCARACGCQV